MTRDRESLFRSPRDFSCRLPRPSRPERGWDCRSRPASSRSTAAPSPASIDRKGAPGSSSPCRGPKRGYPVTTLLIVDDEESVRYSFRRIFATGGVEVLTAVTAAEGLELIRQHNPDVIVLDLQLPDRSGLDLFREVH